MYTSILLMLSCRHVSSSLGYAALGHAVRAVPTSSTTRLDDDMDSLTADPTSFSLRQLQNACAAMQLSMTGGQAGNLADAKEVPTQIQMCSDLTCAQAPKLRSYRKSLSVRSPAAAALRMSIVGQLTTADAMAGICAGLRLSSTVPCPASVVLAVRRDQEMVHKVPGKAHFLRKAPDGCTCPHCTLAGPRETLRKLGALKPDEGAFNDDPKFASLRATLRAHTLPGLEASAPATSAQLRTSYCDMQLG